MKCCNSGLGAKDLPCMLESGTLDKLTLKGSVSYSEPKELYFHFCIPLDLARVLFVVNN